MDTLFKCQKLSVFILITNSYEDFAAIEVNFFLN